MLVIQLKNRYNTKINEIEKKITDHEFNKLTSDNCTSILKQPNLASRNDIPDFVKKADFNNKLRKLNENVTSNKTKHVLAEN